MIQVQRAKLIPIVLIEHALVRKESKTSQLTDFTYDTDVQKFAC